MSKTLLIRPRVSEKAYGTAKSGIYIFVVPKEINKMQIAEAVHAQFDVDVLSVNTVNQMGKAVRFYRKGKFDNGNRSDSKKAYVRLAEGQSIPIFAADDQEDAPEPDKKAAKAAKKAAKE